MTSESRYQGLAFNHRPCGALAPSSSDNNCLLKIVGILGLLKLKPRGNTMPELKIHQGACHCGAIKFEIDAPSQLHAHACNCSICYKSGGDQMIVPASRFRLVCGAGAITTYTFNTDAAQHTFCKHCGIKAFYTPRSNPDGFSVNLRCLDRTYVESIVVDTFDGQNWEQNAASLAHLSRED